MLISLIIHIYGILLKIPHIFQQLQTKEAIVLPDTRNPPGSWYVQINKKKRQKYKAKLTFEHKMSEMKYKKHWTDFIRMERNYSATEGGN